MKTYTITIKAEYPYIPKYNMEESITAFVSSGFYSHGFKEVEVKVEETKNDLSS